MPLSIEIVVPSDTLQLNVEVRLARMLGRSSETGDRPVLPGHRMTIHYSCWKKLQGKISVRDYFRGEQVGGLEPFGQKRQNVPASHSYGAKSQETGDKKRLLLGRHPAQAVGRLGAGFGNGLNRDSVKLGDLPELQTFGAQDQELVLASGQAAGSFDQSSEPLAFQRFGLSIGSRAQRLGDLRFEIGERARGYSMLAARVVGSDVMQDPDQPRFRLVHCVPLLQKPAQAQEALLHIVVRVGRLAAGSQEIPMEAGVVFPVQILNYTRPPA